MRSFLDSGGELFPPDQREEVFQVAARFRELLKDVSAFVSHLLGLQQKHGAPVGEVVEQVLGLVVEDGKNGFGAGEKDAVAHQLPEMNGLFRRHMGSEPLGGTLQVLGLQDYLADGQHNPLVDGLEGPLIQHIKKPDGINEIAEKLDPNGIFGQGWIDVQYPSTHGEVATLLYELGPVISPFHETSDEGRPGPLPLPTQDIPRADSGLPGAGFSA